MIWRGQSQIAELGGRLRFADVRLVIGTRPEAIKLAPVVQALKTYGIAPRLILTGQHPALDPADYGLAGFEATHLRCRAQADPHAFAFAVATRLADQMIDRPAMIVVQGDTSSAFGGALAAEALGVPLAHVEAGLRTHDLTMPWPEEEFRVGIDARAGLLFAPTELSAASLRAESVGGAIHVTGNTAIDAVLAVCRSLPPPPAYDSSPRLLVTCHRRESWGDGLRSIAEALVTLSSEVRIRLILHPNPKVADAMRAALSAAPDIQLAPPCSHIELLSALRSATLTLSDSGGIQEEAAALGAPLLVLRDKTERPEAIDTGNMILVGTETARIVAETRRLLADANALSRMARPAFPYGDGHASGRIAALIAESIEQQKRARSR